MTCIHCKMKEKLKTSCALVIILILLPYVAAVFRTGEMQGLTEEKQAPDLEDFVAGILPGQMPVTYEEEALKAQAIVIRTNLLKNYRNEYKEKTIAEAAEAIGEEDLEKLGFVYQRPEALRDLWGLEYWELYQEKTERAVKATEGKVLTVGGELVDLPYHAVSAGQTREGGILGAGYEYLEKVECPDDFKSAEYLNVQIFSMEELQEKWATENEELSEATQGTENQQILPEIISRDAAGYVTEVRLGTESLPGEEFRNRLALNSSCFFLEPMEEGIRITTKGLGHGLGMSMYQANLQAQKGAEYPEILAYFYKGTACTDLHLKEQE